MGKMIEESGSSADPLDAVAGLMDSPTEGRDPSPPITADDLQSLRRNDRLELIERLDEENPEFKHSYAKPDSDPRLLERKGQEILEGEHHFEDPVVRQDRSKWDRKREIEAMASAATVERITDPENDIYQMRQPKKPLRTRKRRTA
jgi:hypothetical protein